MLCLIIQGFDSDDIRALDYEGPQETGKLSCSKMYVKTKNSKMFFYNLKTRLSLNLEPIRSERNNIKFFKFCFDVQIKLGFFIKKHPLIKFLTKNVG